ncbi:hypothetical protein HR060_07310 [Catenovulum sp. SM1970]|uniref:spondin domain-containing protein n=1 Tax=Marinifaba aquimaris TaxID=2741323 RepID=UPI001573FA77|nr:spondin domain-containing protein [Marinifaba aquimaris]NTS76674.1 hypothetical protein [Marinifaba aquimaris]
MKKQLALLALTAAITSQAQAAKVEVTINNATAGTAFTPYAVSAHNKGVKFYTIGEMASAELQAIAEGGDTSMLIEKVNMSGYGMASQQNPESGLTFPGQSHTFMLDTMDYKYLSIASMLLPSNDGFVGLDSWTIPQVSGTYSIKLDGYDAGTELNDEIVNGGGMPGAAGIPANPIGMSNTGGMAYPYLSENEYVHVHPGIVGDNDPMGGYSDLDSRVHRFLNPVATVTIKVMADEAMMWSGEQVAYEVGDMVSYMGMTYKVVHAHTSNPTWKPGSVWFFEAYSN